MMTSHLLQLVAAALATAASALGFGAWHRARIAAGPAADRSPARGPLRALLAPLAAQLRPSRQRELDELTSALLLAGRRSRDAVDRYLEDRLLFVLGGLATALAAAFAVGGLAGMLLADLAILCGLIGPRRQLAWRAAERRESIQHGLPPAVDLLTTCIEAGLSLEQAVARVARDLALSSPVLADELALTASELGAGVSLPDALRRLSKRVGLDELSALCGVTAQAHGLGAPIGQTLREYADSSRRQRMSVLEERAGKAATQLTIPLAVCFLPAAMLVILGPAAVQLVRALQ